MLNVEHSRVFKEDYPYTKGVHDSNWQSNTLKGTIVVVDVGNIHNVEPS